jgi:ArsR family metal-binding transcriptional regulator
LIHIVEFPSEEKDRIERARDYAEYKHRHAVCPQCGGKQFEQTCMGFIMTDLETHVDRNVCKCLCGWRGYVHDLVAETKMQNGRAPR